MNAWVKKFWIEWVEGKEKKKKKKKKIQEEEISDRCKEKKI